MLSMDGLIHWTADGAEHNVSVRKGCETAQRCSALQPAVRTDSILSAHAPGCRMSRRRNECSTAQYGISFHAYVQSAATTCSDW